MILFCDVVLGIFGLLSLNVFCVIFDLVFCLMSEYNFGAFSTNRNSVA